jgi:hypothetical protein
MSRARPLVIALIVTLSACSGGTNDDAADGGANQTTNDSVAAGGEVGAPVLDGGDRGHYVPLKSARSFESLKGDTSPTDQSGVLLSVQGGDGGPFIVAMEDDAAQYLRINKGWQVTEIARDPSWRPAASAGVPHLAVGAGWVVSFRIAAAGEDDREGVATNAVLEGYEIASRTYHTTTAIDAAHSLFTRTLHVVDDHTFSFLFADGAIDDTRIPYIVRRTVDLNDFRFVDEAIDIGNTNRMVNAVALDDGYVVDLQRPKSERQGVFVRLEKGSTDPTLQLTMKEAPTPTTLDGYRVESAAKPLVLVGSSGVKTALPSEFASAAVAGAVNNLVYLRYVATSARAISADGFAVVDVTKGTVATAFDLSGTSGEATGPPADAGWATGASRALLVGAPTG